MKTINIFSGTVSLIIDKAFKGFGKYVHDPLPAH